jgi:hypothetical protein
MAIINRRKKLTYQEALYWLVQNDDNKWIFKLTEKGTKSSNSELIPTLTAAVVADIYGYSAHELAADLMKYFSLKKTKVENPQ